MGNYSPPFWGGVGGEAVGGEAVLFYTKGLSETI